MDILIIAKTCVGRTHSFRTKYIEMRVCVRNVVTSRSQRYSNCGNVSVMSCCLFSIRPGTVTASYLTENEKCMNILSISNLYCISFSVCINLIFIEEKVTLEFRPLCAFISANRMRSDIEKCLNHIVLCTFEILLPGFNNIHEK
jgi:hypothetical protein